jgi:hypothetical protein
VLIPGDIGVIDTLFGFDWHVEVDGGVAESWKNTVPVVLWRSRKAVPFAVVLVTFVVDGDGYVIVGIPDEPLIRTPTRGYAHGLCTPSMDQTAAVRQEEHGTVGSELVTVPDKGAVEISGTWICQPKP